MIFSLFNGQVNNRDISIAVLRTFIEKRKEEHEARLLKRTKAVTTESEKNASEHGTEAVSNGSAVNGEKSNGDCKIEEKMSQDEPCGTSEEVATTMEGKGPAQLKPPRVLEVSKLCFLFISCFVYHYA